MKQNPHLIRVPPWLVCLLSFVKHHFRVQCLNVGRIWFLILGTMVAEGHWVTQLPKVILIVGTSPGTQLQVWFWKCPYLLLSQGGKSPGSYGAMGQCQEQKEASVSEHLLTGPQRTQGTFLKMLQGMNPYCRILRNFKKKEGEKKGRLILSHPGNSHGCYFVYMPSQTVHFYLSLCSPGKGL